VLPADYLDKVLEIDQLEEQFQKVQSEKGPSVIVYVIGTI